MLVCVYVWDGGSEKEGSEGGGGDTCARIHHTAGRVQQLRELPAEPAAEAAQQQRGHKQPRRDRSPVREYSGHKVVGSEERKAGAAKGRAARARLDEVKQEAEGGLG